MKDEKEVYIRYHIENPHSHTVIKIFTPIFPQKMHFFICEYFKSRNLLDIQSERFYFFHSHKKYYIIYLD